MCILQIHAHCYDRFFEVIPDDVQSTELVVEELVSHVLLDLFGEGSVDDVTMCFTSKPVMGLQHCSIQIHAQCSCERFSLFPPTKENIKLTVQKEVGFLLKELFGSVNVDIVILSLSPWDYGSDPALSCSM